MRARRSTPLGDGERSLEVVEPTQVTEACPCPPSIAERSRDEPFEIESGRQGDRPVGPLDRVVESSTDHPVGSDGRVTVGELGPGRLTFQGLDRLSKPTTPPFITPLPQHGGQPVEASALTDAVPLLPESSRGLLERSLGLLEPTGAQTRFRLLRQHARTILMRWRKEPKGLVETVLGPLDVQAHGPLPGDHP